MNPRLKAFTSRFSDPHGICKSGQALQRLVLATGLMIALPVAAQTTISINTDYAEGKYGETEKSSTWTTPLILKHQADRFSIKLNVPYVRATGTAAAGGDRFTFTRQTQDGLGDITTTFLYAIIGEPGDDLLVEIGAKAKLAPPGKTQELISTGKNDYSLLVESLRNFGTITVFGTLGKTKKGDTADSDFRDPWFTSLGFSHRVNPAWSWGLLHDYRQRVTPRGDPISEATLFAEHKFSREYRMQAYLLRGFSDASADIGVGVTIGRRF